MKPSHFFLILLLLLTGSSTQVVATPAIQRDNQTVPPTTITGVMGVFCPKEAFNHAH